MPEEKKEKKQKSSLWKKTKTVLHKKDQKEEISKSSVGRKKKTTIKEPSSPPPATPIEDEEQSVTDESEEEKQSHPMLLKLVEEVSRMPRVSSPKKCRKKRKEKDVFTPTQTNEPAHVWDENLAEMEISKKRQSVFDREVKGSRRATIFRHMRMLLPTPECYTVAVRKMKPEVEKKQMFAVLKPADPRAGIREIIYCGPRLNRQGQIIPHSILGEVSDFLKEAERRGQFQEITKSHTVAVRKSEVLPRYKLSPRVPENPLLNEKLALQTWDREMMERKLEMKRLADLTGRPERQLLMSTVDDVVCISGGRKLLGAALDNKSPGVCFWKLQHAEGGKQIRTTLPKHERGIIPTPEMRGDAATIRQEKGSLRDLHESSWFKLDYMKERDEQAGGIIKIYNQMLFDDLEVYGKSVAKQPDSSDSAVAIDNISHCSPRGDADSHMPDTNKESLIREEESVTFSGPSLQIENTILKWVKGHYQGNSVVKTVYVLIEGLVGDMVSNHIFLHNCGTTSIKYHWLKCFDANPIPVPRPTRPAAFYLCDEDGVVLPGDTAKITVKFRSQVPGCFSEDWLLGTAPVLAAGRRIKLVVKGWARAKKSYDEECRLIQEALKKREAVSLCSYLTKEIIEKIILQASFQYNRLREDFCCPTEEELFVNENPGLFFHANVVKKLKTLYNSLSLEITGTSSLRADDSLSVAQLRKVILSLPDDEGDSDVDGADDEDDGEDHNEDDNDEIPDRKDVLLWKLYKDVKILSFPPFIPFMSRSHLRYMICRGLLRDGLEHVVDLASCLACSLDIVITPTLETESSVEKETASSTKGKGKGISSAKPKMKKAETSQENERSASPVYPSRAKKRQSCKDSENSPQEHSQSDSPVYPSRAKKRQSCKDSENSPQKHSQSDSPASDSRAKKRQSCKDNEIASPEKRQQLFSPVYQYRLKNPSADAILNLYDEKVYIMMYRMLDRTVCRMIDLFENF